MYEINTVINKVISQKINYKLFTVFILVDSYSNLLEFGKPISITNLEQFNLYFPDEEKDRTDSLKTAFKLLSVGYRLIVVNIHNSKRKETLRIFSDKTYNWFDEIDELGKIDAEIHSENSLAIKFDVRDLKENCYILLEHNIRGVSSNTLIYTHDRIPLNAINYMSNSTYRIDPNLKLEDKINELIKVLSTKCNYITKLDEDGHTIHVANNYEFISITNTKGVKLEYDPVFEQKYKNALKFDKRILDVKSKYNTDINDLKIKFVNQDSKIYKLFVYKFYNKDNIVSCEIFTDTSYNDLIIDVKNNSRFIEIESYSEDLFEGTFELTNINEPYTVKIDDYFSALIGIEEFKDTETKYEFDTNIVYEPDIDASKETKYTLQLLLESSFDDIDNPIIKLMNFLNIGSESDSIHSCYVSDFKYIYKGTEYNSKELYLTLLINNELNKAHEDIKILNYQDIKFPEFVNSPTKNMKSLSFDNLKCNLVGNYFDIRDILLISSINYLINSSTEDKTKYLMYDIIEIVQEFYTKNLGYSPKILLLRFEQIDNTVEIDFEYYVQTRNSVEMLNLVLDI